MTPAHRRRTGQRVARRTALLCLALALAASCAGSGSRSIGLDPSESRGLRVVNARPTMRGGALELSRGPGRQMSVVVERQELERAGVPSVEAAPILHVRLRSTSRPPSPLKGSVIARIGGAPAVLPFDAGLPAPGRPVELWFDLGALPQTDGDEQARLERLELRFDGAPERLEVHAVELTRRTEASVLGRLGMRIREPRSLEGGTLALLVALATGTIAALGEITGAVMRLPRPLPPAVARNAAARLAALWPQRLLGAMVAALALLGIASGIRSAADVHAAWRSVGGWSDRDYREARLAAIHREMLPLIAAVRRTVPRDGSVSLRGRGLGRGEIAAVRHALWPRRVLVDGDAPWTASLARAGVPAITQRRQGRWLRLDAAGPVGQVYQVPHPGRHVLGVSLEARGVEPGETLELRLYATGRGRKVHAVARSEGGAAFRFTPPEWLHGAETRFEVVHAGGGDGLVEIAAGPGNPLPGSFAFGSDVRLGDDLTFTLWMAPPGHVPVALAGEGSCVLRRDAP